MHKITLWANFVIWNLKMTQHCFYINIWTVFLTFLFPKYGPHPIKRQNVDFTLEIFFFFNQILTNGATHYKTPVSKRIFCFFKYYYFFILFWPPSFLLCLHFKNFKSQWFILFSYFNYIFMFCSFCVLRKR